MRAAIAYWTLIIAAALLTSPLVEAGGVAYQSKAKEDSGASGKPSIEELYVKDTLKDFLRPAKMKFLKDGRVELFFDFDERIRVDKSDGDSDSSGSSGSSGSSRSSRTSRSYTYVDRDPDLGQSFIPPVQDKIKSPFRWSVRYEYPKGLRIANAGVALLNCWFEDDIEAEMTYSLGTSTSSQHVVALIYCNAKKDAIGSNLGTQCIYLKRVKSITKRRGKGHTLAMERETPFRLTVKNGVFEAGRGKSARASMEYSEKNFKSGRVGFFWGGRAAGMISQLKITGKIDYKAMAKEMKKKKSRKSRR